MSMTLLNKGLDDKIRGPFWTDITVCFFLILSEESQGRKRSDKLPQF